MPNNNAVNNLLIGLGAAQQARAEADNDRLRAVQAERRAMAAEMESSRASTDADLKRKMLTAMAEKQIAQDQADSLRESLKEQQLLLTEWMHSNEAFKRLARQYGKNLGITDQQRQQDVDQHILDIAEEDPKFADTKAKKVAEARSSMKK